MTPAWRRLEGPRLDRAPTCPDSGRVSTPQSSEVLVSARNSDPGRPWGALRRLTLGAVVTIAVGAAALAVSGGPGRDAAGRTGPPSPSPAPALGSATVSASASQDASSGSVVGPVPLPKETVPATEPGLPVGTAIPTPCGGSLPFDVTVPDAIAAPVYRRTQLPGGGIAAAGSWQIPAGTIQVQWPPSPRPLYRAGSRERRLDAVGSWGGSGRSLTIYSQSPLPGPGPAASRYIRVRITLKPQFALMPGRPCDRIQFRFTAPDGRTETHAFYLLTSDATDWGPLVDRTIDLPGPVPPGKSVQCEKPSTSGAVPVRASALAPAPAQALRAFLDSPAGAPVDAPAANGPYTEYRLHADGTYRYEHYTTWTDHTSVTVARIRRGWTVITYRTTC